MTVVLIDAPLSDTQRERIEHLSPHLDLIDGMSAAGLQKAQIIYTNKARFDPADAPQMRWIQLNTAGAEQVMHTPIAQAGIPVANVRGAYSVAVAELAISLLLALTRRHQTSHALQERRQWPDDISVLQGENCYGKTMGIVGYGASGRQIAAVARTMGMRVLACKRRPDVKRYTDFSLPNAGDPDGLIPEAWFGIEDVDRMLSMSDVAVVTLPLTDATRGIIGNQSLEALPAHAYLINVGRGGVVDEVALADSLERGTLAGAGLDVFEQEPLPSDSPLWKLPNLIVTPHVASYTREQQDLAAEVLIENLSRELDGRPLVNLVDLQLGY